VFGATIGKSSDIISDIFLPATTSSDTRRRSVTDPTIDPSLSITGSCEKFLSSIISATFSTVSVGLTDVTLTIRSFATSSGEACSAHDAGRR